MKLPVHVTINVSFCSQTKCGLPLSPYFSALKIRWLMDNVPEVQTAIGAGTCLFGTVDSWLMWVSHVTVM